MTNITTLPPITSGKIVHEGIAGGPARITNDFLRSIEQRHRKTPVFDPNEVPRAYRAHIGGGIWIKRCRYCDDYALTYGSLVYIWQLAQHEATHGEDVPGYNTPLMS